MFLGNLNSRRILERLHKVAGIVLHDNNPLGDAVFLLSIFNDLGQNMCMTAVESGIGLKLVLAIRYNLNVSARG